MRITSLSRRRKAFAALGVAAVAAAAVVAVAPNANAASAALTLSATSGPSGGTNALTATTATNVFSTGANVEFQYKATTSTTCSAAWTAAVTPATGVGNVLIVAANVKILTAKKIAFTVPAGVSLTPAGSATTASWLVCVYPGTNTTTSLLAANASYTVGAAPTVTAISPAGGPALGGGSITITGANYTSTTTAKIGSVPLTGVTVNSAGTSLTGTVPSQAAGAMNVSVTNTGGTSAPAAAGASTYTYSNGIIVSPNTAPTNTAVTDVDIQGVGFSSLTFTHTTGANIADITSHVYLVDGEYDPTGTKAEPEIAECLNVLVIADDELICTVNTADSDGAGASGTVIADGTYTLTVVSDGLPDVQAGGTGWTGGVEDPTYSQSIVSSGSTFTVAPY